MRFSVAWKPVEKLEATKMGMRGFGYPMHGVPGEPPAKVWESLLSIVWSKYGILFITLLPIFS